MAVDIYTRVSSPDAPSEQTREASSPRDGLAATPAVDGTSEDDLTAGRPRLLQEVVVEEISIDGMCGVY